MEHPQIPGYRVCDLIATGGMASVYLAEQISTNRMVALKIMAPHLLRDKTFSERFLREARIVAQLSHPHFVAVYDVGSHEDFHYMSMEYLRGGDLKSLMSSGLALADGIAIAKDLASALDYAANHNFVHRDIKPENVLMRIDGSAVICDFGIAKRTDSTTQMTAVGTVVGTPHYMSPEQAQANKLDGRSDLYSLGVIVFEMLCGHVPYNGDSAVSTGIMHVTEPIPRLPADFSGFQAFIDRALAKKPEERFQSGLEMLFALEDLEEAEVDLMHLMSKTEVLSQQDLQDSLQASAARPANATSRASGSARRPSHRHRRASRSTPRPTVVRNNSLGRFSLVALSVAATVGLSTTGWWVYERASSDKTSSSTKTPAPLAGLPGENFALKTQELRQLARDAIKAGRLYGASEDNAQTYLTTLMVLAPNDAEGLELLTQLSTGYLQQAEQAIEAGRLQEANAVLNQASQISFYLNDTALASRQSALRRDYILAQQKAIVSSEREQDIATLLANGARQMGENKRTSPVGDNAYESYQQALAIDPGNSVATRGIRDIAESFLAQADQQIEAGELGRARAYVAAATQVFPQHPRLAMLRERLRAEEQQNALVEQRRSGSTDSQSSGQVQQDRERWQNIESLLDGADQNLAQARLNTPPGDNAIEKYQSVLVLDPGNVRALDGLEDTAVQFTEQASALIDAGKLDEAEQALAQVRVLSPTNPRYVSAQTRLLAARDQATQLAAAEQARSQRITALLGEAQDAVEAGNIYSPRDANALEKLRLVLELDEQNPHALAMRAELGERVYQKAERDIAAQRFKQAAVTIDALVASDVDSARITALRSQLQQSQTLALEGNRSRQPSAKPPPSQNFARNQKSVQELLDEAAALRREEGVHSENATALADRYQQALELDRDNTYARQGLASIADFNATLTREALAAYNVTAAENHLGALESISPRHSQLSELRTLVGEARKARQATIEQLNAASAIIEAPYQKPGFMGNNRKARRTLKKAGKIIQTARETYGDSALSKSLEQKLIEKYLGIIDSHLDDRDYDDAQDFMDDLSDTRFSEGHQALARRELNLYEDAMEQRVERVNINSF